MIRLARMLDGAGRGLRRDQGGYSLPELSVAIIVGTVILGGLFTLVNFTVRSNARTTNRVAADQLARPAMQRIVDELHSACIYPGLAPVQAGSTGSQITFVTSHGSAANPTPIRRRITLNSNGSLTDNAYAQSGGTAPNWTFWSSPYDQYTLLQQASALSPTTAVFRYYKYSAGAISATPLPTPLTTENAKLTVQVTVGFKTGLSQGASAIDPNNAIALSESVLMRFSPSNEDTNKAGLPCT